MKKFLATLTGKVLKLVNKEDCPGFPHLNNRPICRDFGAACNHLSGVSMCNTPNEPNMRLVTCLAAEGLVKSQDIREELEKVQDDLNKHISEHSPIVEELDTYEGEETTPACIHVKRAYNRLGELLDLLHRR